MALELVTIERVNPPQWTQTILGGPLSFINDDLNFTGAITPPDVQTGSLGSGASLALSPTAAVASQFYLIVFNKQTGSQRGLVEIQLFNDILGTTLLEHHAFLLGTAGQLSYMKIFGTTVYGRIVVTSRLNNGIALKIQAGPGAKYSASGGGGTVTIDNFKDLINLKIQNNNQSNNRPVGSGVQRDVGPNPIP